jgi:hypothetical protein
MFQEEEYLCSTKMDHKRVIEWRGNGAIHKEKVGASIYRILIVLGELPHLSSRFIIGYVETCIEFCEMLKQVLYMC